MNLLGGIARAFTSFLRRPRRGQFAALCWRLPEGSAQPEILLLTSRDTGRWVIPKGWPMGIKPGFRVAEQEALEEAGVIGEVETAPLGHYHYDKAFDEGYAVPVEVEVYALKVTGFVDEFKEKDQRRLEWVMAEVAAQRVREPELQQIIRTFARHFE